MVQSSDLNSDRYTLKLADIPAATKSEAESKCLQDAYRNLHTTANQLTNDPALRNQFKYQKDQCIGKTLSDKVWNEQVAPGIDTMINDGKEAVRIDYSKVAVDKIGMYIANKLSERNYVNEPRDWIKDIVVKF